MINIQDIIPFLKNGWVAMDKDGTWIWFEKEPYILDPQNNFIWFNNRNSGSFVSLGAFNIALAQDWTKSLICIKGKNNE